MLTDMKSGILNIIFLLVLTIASGQLVKAQVALNKDWSAEKIKGTRFFPYATYDGFPFLTNLWSIGEVVFADGEVSDTLNLRYSSYKDDLVYYNKTINTQIVIDKESLKGFWYKGEDGIKRVFRKQYYDGFWKGDRFFEVLSEGKTDLLAYRKVSMNGTSVYKDANGIMKNMEYSQDYTFYFYSPGKGYLSVKIGTSSLLSKFDKTEQKPIKKIMNICYYT